MDKPHPNEMMDRWLLDDLIAEALGGDGVLPGITGACSLPLEHSFGAC